MDWFLYDNGLRHEKFKNTYREVSCKLFSFIREFFVNLQTRSLRKKLFHRPFLIILPRFPNYLLFNTTDLNGFSKATEFTLYKSIM